MGGHRVVTGTQHDQARGWLHGCCEVCAEPWPCETERKLFDAELGKLGSVGEQPTLRDRFAMAALPGLLYLMTEQRDGDLVGVAENAYYLADAMLRARTPQPGQEPAP